MPFNCILDQLLDIQASNVLKIGYSGDYNIARNLLLFAPTVVVITLEIGSIEKPAPISGDVIKEWLRRWYWRNLATGDCYLFASNSVFVQGDCHWKRLRVSEWLRGPVAYSTWVRRWFVKSTHDIAIWVAQAIHLHTPLVLRESQTVWEPWPY